MPLPRPSPTNLLGDPGYELDLVLDQYADEIEATSAAIPGKLDATDAAIGAAIAAAGSKATPVDGDNLLLADSAASNTAKRLTWANLKSALQTALDGVFARLAGLAGGQTLTGGTAASESLTLRSTSHATKGKVLLGTGAAYDETTTRLGVGTQSPAAELHALATTEQLRLGYDASNYLSATVSATGGAVLAATGNPLGLQAANTGLATRGSELLTNASFASDLSGWTDSGASWSWSSGSAQHTAGSASTLSQSISVTSGSTYQIDLTISGRTAGSVSITLGSVSVVNFGSSTAISSSVSKTLVAADTGSVNLTIAPTSDFDGKVDDISCKVVNIGSAAPVFTTRDGAGVVLTEVRHGTSSMINTGWGVDCLRSLTTGVSNVGLGRNSLYSLTTGSENTAVGRAALYSSTIGNENTAFGREVLYALTTGQDNTAVGYRALYGATTMGNVTAIGQSAARYIADGSTAATSCTNSVYVGSNTKLSANSANNENVFGYNATGIGNNSTVIGSSAVTKCQIFGDIILEPAPSGADRVTENSTTRTAAPHGSASTGRTASSSPAAGTSRR